MKVPQQGPLGVQLLAHEDGAFLTVEEEAPFWMFWKVTRRSTVQLNKFGLIWLYQAITKLMRRNVMEAGYDELADDLTRSCLLADQQAGGLTTRGDKWYEYVAVQMRAKGWVKM